MPGWSFAQGNESLLALRAHGVSDNKRRNAKGAVRVKTKFITVPPDWRNVTTVYGELRSNNASTAGGGGL